MSEKPVAVVPPAEQRMPCERIAAPHPATLPVENLLAQCELRTQRRSGPGGQHRNKTSSGAFLTHLPTGVVGEATERRSQAQNRVVALQRLRYQLATSIRTGSPLAPLGQDDDTTEAAIRKRYHGHSLRLNENNEDKPAVLSLVLNDFWIAGGQPSLVSPIWSASTSKLVSLIRSHPAALTWVNRVRAHADRPPLH